MSDKKFFNLGRAIFNTEDVSQIFETKQKVEIEQPAAVITFKDGRQEIMPLPEGKSLADFVTGTSLNAL